MNEKHSDLAANGELKREHEHDELDSDSITTAPEPPTASTTLPEVDKTDVPLETAPTTASASDQPDYITGAPLWAVLAAMTLAGLLLFLDTSIIATAIPRITDEFQSLPDVGWYGGAYQLGVAALTPLSGKIYQRFSSKWTFLSFFAVFEIGSVICGCATDSRMLIVGRAIAGMGGAGILSGSLTVIASAVPLSERATAMGIVIGLAQLGMVLGPLLGGVFTELATWRWSFWINLPTGAVCAVVLVLVRIPDQVQKPRALDVLKRLHRELDLLGFVLFALAAVMLLLALEYGSSSFAWDSSTVIGLFVGSGVDFCVWMVWNYWMGEGALIPVSMIKQLPVWTSLMVQGFGMAGLYTMTYYLPVFFQAVQGLSPLDSGVHLLPIIVSMLLFGILAGIAVSKTGYVIPYAFTGTILTTIGAGLLTTLSAYSSMGEWFGYQVLAGIGRGLTIQMVRCSCLRI
jgi:MFS family permease